MTPGLEGSGRAPRPGCLVTTKQEGDARKPRFREQPPAVHQHGPRSALALHPLRGGKRKSGTRGQDGARAKTGQEPAGDAASQSAPGAELLRNRAGTQVQKAGSRGPGRPCTSPPPPPPPGPGRRAPHSARQSLTTASSPAPAPPSHFPPATAATAAALGMIHRGGRDRGLPQPQGQPSPAPAPRRFKRFSSFPFVLTWRPSATTATF